LTYPVPPNEVERLAALTSLEVLDTPPEAHFDAVVSLARRTFCAPIVLISLVDADRQWFKSGCGIEVDGTPRDVAFCAYTILSDEPLVVEDATRDERFAANPVVTGAPGIRFYAGVPLIIEPGIRVGTLCVIDTKPRTFSEEDQKSLQEMADIVVAHLRLHKAHAVIQRQAAWRIVTERQLIKNEAFLRSVLDSSTDCIKVVELDGSLSFMNANGLCAMELESFERVKGMQWADLWPPETAHQVRQAVASAVKGRTERFVASCPTANGTPKWWDVSVAPVQKPDGRVVSLVAVSRDITERVHSETVIREAEERLRLALEAGHLATWDWDIASGEVVWSDQHFTLLGYAVGEIAPTYRVWAERVHPDDLVDTEERIGHAMQAKQPYEHALRFLHPDGNVVWCEAQGKFSYDEAGAPVRMVGVLRDITEQRAIEHALRESKLAAEAASHAKSEFLASMSHEIRTPLHGVLGYADLLLDDDLTPEQERKVRRIQGSGTALLNVVNDILDFSKIEAGQVVMQQEPFCLESLIGSAADIVRAPAEAKGVVLRVLHDTDLPALVGDESRLRQVLLNLLNNAVKFTKEGSVALRVRCAPVDDAGVRVRVEVTDTGVGIPADKIDRLFLRFSQIDGSLSREFGGTGLGLAISKHLVELMGGTIGVESEVDTGSTFWFELVLAPYISQPTQ
jgi:PAS domain S-box-containing protein